MKIRAFAAEQGLNVGCNVESVSSRAEEVEASVELVHRIDRLAPRALVDDVDTLAAVLS